MKKDNETLSSFRIQFRIGTKKPVERAAVEYLRERLAAGEDTRDVIARALADAANSKRREAELMTQLEAMMKNMEDLIRRGVLSAGTAIPGDGAPAQGAAVSEELRANMRKVIGAVRRAGNIQESD